MGEVTIRRRLHDALLGVLDASQEVLAHVTGAIPDGLNPEVVYALEEALVAYEEVNTSEMSPIVRS